MGVTDDEAGGHPAARLGPQSSAYATTEQSAVRTSPGAGALDILDRRHPCQGKATHGRGELAANRHDRGAFSGDFRRVARPFHAQALYLPLAVIGAASLAYDTPALAKKGLEAARRYSQIAPAAPHALHMPSHIFTRVGYWKETISSNTESARAAKASNEAHDQLHAMDYLVYAYLQTGQDAKAEAVIEEMREVSGFSETFIAGPYALAVSPARYAIERGDWNAAAQLTVRPTPSAHVEAMTHFARALGAARTGKLDAAKTDIARLAELRDKLREAKDNYWADQVDIQWQVATAWALYAEGKSEDALKAMSAAADAEDRTEKHPVTPGVPTPARELYGTMLLERGMAKEALAAFEATLKKEPNQLGATLGAAAAAEQSGDSEKARAHYAAAVALTENADPVRPQIAHARAIVEKSAR